MPESQAAAGSYAFGTFEKDREELERLERQASIALPLERAVWERAGLRPGMRVLDLACGPGIVSQALARHVAPAKVVGVDLSQDLLAEARRLQQEAEPLPNLEFRQGNVYDLDLDDASFDFVYARFLFQHLSEPLRALTTIRRVLRPGGVLCAVDVDDAWLMLQPEPVGFEPFTRAAATGQTARGGDRYVGRKLAACCHEAGLADARTDVQVITSHAIGLKTFLDITTGFKSEQIPVEEREMAEAWLAEIYGLLGEPRAWGAVGVFVITARRSE